MNLHLKNVQNHVLGEIGETNNVTFFFKKKQEKFKLNKVFKESLSEQTSLLVNMKKKSS